MKLFAQKNSRSNSAKSILKNGLVLSAIALPLVGLAAPKAMADKRNFEIYNDSSEHIEALYMTASNMESWGGNLVGRRGMPSGYSMPVDFEDPSRDFCLYDIRTVFADGSVVEDYEVDVCHNDYYSLVD